MTFNKRTIGADKEQLAAEYLIDNGYTVLERNFRSRTGEIDIIASKDNFWYLLRLNTEAIHAMVLLLKLSIIKNSRL